MYGNGGRRRHCKFDTPPRFERTGVGESTGESSGLRLDGGFSISRGRTVPREHPLMKIISITVAMMVLNAVLPKYEDSFPRGCGYW